MTGVITALPLLLGAAVLIIGTAVDIACIHPGFRRWLTTEKPS
jgi:hypothetical protein